MKMSSRGWPLSQDSAYCCNASLWIEPYLIRNVLNFLVIYLFDVDHFQSLHFGHEGCVILALWPGIILSVPALEGEILTIGSPNNLSQYRFPFLMLGYIVLHLHENQSYWLTWHSLLIIFKISSLHFHLHIYLPLYAEYVLCIGLPLWLRHKVSACNTGDSGSVPL